MKGPMKLIDASSGLMECPACGSTHNARLQSEHDRADGITRYCRGSYQCSNEQCPSKVSKVLAKGFGIREREVTKAYLSVAHLSYEQKFPEVVQLLLRGFDEIHGNQ